MSQNRFQWEVRPIAPKENQVIGRHCRFTVLTDRLIRLEYDPQDVFEDRASQSIFYRDMEKVDLTVERANGLMTVKTGQLILQYKEGAAFSPETLSIKLVNEPASTWRFGEEFEDLGGTAQTLDTVDESCPVGSGVCSRFGFSVLDDSATMLLGADGWIETRAENTKDLYFFGYGYDYRGAVRDYFRITGAPPMLPAYALGNWWSRFHRYTQEEYISLMERFREEDIPFSVSVVDMDWHIVDIPQELKDPDLPSLGTYKDGWTGYTWNEALFPDYKAFLDKLHSLGLKTALNLHPAQGVRRHEKMYEQAARAVGIDPKSGKRVPLNILSQAAMASYFDIIHHPYEEDGVDFWWMDWQQGTDYWWIHEPNKPGQYADHRERVDPLWMLNHLHILDISRNGKRPMFFSRFAGPGSHRYPVGFSGDTIISWEALQFQPWFTATASNIGYCWWSHDIGGHMGGYRDDELTVRWAQLGTFSPINRLHSSNNPFLQKEVWCYGAEAEKATGKWLRLRHQLFPYIYTMNYRCHKELQPLVQPMYYSHPKCGAAYEVPNQFWFGSELMVAPITEPSSKLDNLGGVKAWLPKGDWFDFETGLHYLSKKGRKMELFRPLDEYPVLAKAGAIVPMAVHSKHDNSLGGSRDMEVLVFPGSSNSFTLYEDSGEYHDYEAGAFATTQLTLEHADKAVFTVHPAQGDVSLIPEDRNWTLIFRGFHRDCTVKVSVNGVQTAAQVALDEKHNSIVVKVSAPTAAKIEATVAGTQLIHDNRDAQARIFDILSKAQTSFTFKQTCLDQLASSKSLHMKFHWIGHDVPQEYHMVMAIKELMTLTEEEFEKEKNFA